MGTLEESEKWEEKGEKAKKKIKVRKWKQTVLAIGSLHRHIERRWSQNKSVNIRMQNILKVIGNLHFTQ